MEGVFESLEKRYPPAQWDVEVVSGLTDIGILLISFSSPFHLFGEGSTEKRYPPVAGRGRLRTDTGLTSPLLFSSLFSSFLIFLFLFSSPFLLLGEGVLESLEKRYPQA